MVLSPLWGTLASDLLLPLLALPLVHPLMALILPVLRVPSFSLPTFSCPENSTVFLLSLSRSVSLHSVLFALLLGSSLHPRAGDKPHLPLWTQRSCCVLSFSPILPSPQSLHAQDRSLHYSSTVYSGAAMDAERDSDNMGFT